MIAMHCGSPVQRWTVIPVLAVAAFYVWACDAGAPPLTAELPLHLAEHVDEARVVGSEAPADPPAAVEWRFDQVQPDWKAAVPRNPVVRPLQMASGDQQAFEAAWGRIPKDLHTDTRLLRYYLGRFAEQGWYGAAAEQALFKALDRHWDQGLVETYGRFQARDATKQLTRAEKWLDDFGHDEQLLLALGRISRRARLWGKAQGYFEASIGAHATPAACLELAGLLEQQLQQPDKAVKFYRQGLKLCLEDRT